MAVHAMHVFLSATLPAAAQRRLRCMKNLVCKHVLVCLISQAALHTFSLQFLSDGQTQYNMPTKHILSLSLACIAFVRQLMN